MVGDVGRRAAVGIFAVGDPPHWEVVGGQAVCRGIEENRCGKRCGEGTLDGIVDADANLC